MRLCRGIIIEIPAGLRQHRGRRDAGEERIAEALDAQHDGDVHVRQCDDEALDLIRHRVRVPIGIGDDVAVLAVAVGSAPDEEAQHLRRAQFPRILRAQADTDGRIVIG
jgi:hypothetical protein